MSDPATIDQFDVAGLPDGSQNFNPNGRATYERIAAQSADRAQREGRLTFSHVLELGAASALTALAAGDREAQQRRLKALIRQTERWLALLEET